MMDLCPQQLTGLHEDAFHGLPVVVLTWLGHTMYLFLSTYGSSVLFSEHCPVIQIVAFTFFAKGTHFLVSRER